MSRWGILSGLQSLIPTDAATGPPDVESARSSTTHRKGARMATRAVARRQPAASGETGAAGSVRATGEIADRDLVGMYLDEIARTPLLDAAKEVELSQTIEAGVYAGKILDGEVDSDSAGASREELEALVAEGERAKDVFIRSNLRLVVAVARRYPRSGLPCSTSSRRGTPAWSAPSRSSTTPRASSSPRTPPGGSGRPSPAPSRTSPAPSGSPSTSWRSWAASAASSASSTARTAGTPSPPRSRPS